MQGISTIENILSKDFHHSIHYFTSFSSCPTPNIKILIKLKLSIFKKGDMSASISQRNLITLFHCKRRHNRVWFYSKHRSTAKCLHKFFASPEFTIFDSTCNITSKHVGYLSSTCACRVYQFWSKLRY